MPITTRKTALFLTMLALALTLMLTAACSPGGGDEPEEDTETAEEPEATIIALATRIADMESEIETRDRRIASLESQPTATPEEENSEAGTQEPTTEPGDGPDATMPPPRRQADPTTEGPPPATPGICGRTPQIQEVLLEALTNTLCQNITEHELFRITDLPEIVVNEVRTGDFEGLKNVTELTIRVTDVHLEPGALSGMETLHHATIYANGFAKGSVSEAVNLRTLELILLDPDSPPTVEETQQSLPELKLPHLQTLRVGNLLELHHRTVGPDLTQGLPSLRELTLLTSPQAAQVRRIASLNLRPQLFSGNPKLTTLEIRQGNEQQLQTTLYEDTFHGNPNLVSITIYTHSLDSHPEAMANLHELQILQLHGQPPGTEPVLALSYSAPLQNRIFHGYETPVGYRLPDE